MLLIHSQLKILINQYFHTVLTFNSLLVYASFSAHCMKGEKGKVPM